MMNSALWMLYLADVVSSVSGCLVFTCAAALGYAGIVRLCAGLEDEDCPPSVRPALIIAAVCALVASLIPSKTTLYAIAATQVGEAALETPTGDKAMKALNAWLDRQIAGEKEAE